MRRAPNSDGEKNIHQMFTKYRGKYFPHPKNILLVGKNIFRAKKIFYWWGKYGDGGENMGMALENMENIFLVGKIWGWWGKYGDGCGKYFDEAPHKCM